MLRSGSACTPPEVAPTAQREQRKSHTLATGDRSPTDKSAAAASPASPPKSPPATSPPEAATDPNLTLSSCKVFGPAPDSSNSLATSPGDDGVGARTVSILIVEDDAFSFEVLSSMLEAIAGSSEQYALPPLYLEVSRAASGEEAWDLIEARPRDFDLAFVDIQLPGITGMS